MKWLHLSDIHYNPQNDGRSTQQLREKLPEYLKDRRITADHLFVTGDFRHAGFQKDDDGATAAHAAQFILTIADTAQVDHANIHIVPGNHDLSRTKSVDRLNQILTNYDPNNGRFCKGDATFLTKRFGFFQQVVRELAKKGFVSPWDKTLLPLHVMRCYDDFNLLYLNTSIVCNSKEERGSLILGNHDIYQALQEMKRKKPDNPIIVLAHHGLDNFRDDEKKAVEHLLEEYPVKLYLCGDAHKSNRRTTNGILEITMGCLTYGRGVKTVFSYGELKKGDWSIEAHEWDANESEWGEYSQFNKKLKRWSLSMESAGFPLAKVITKERPALPSAYFIGRKTILEEIEQELCDSRVVLLHGMGGMGKSEICRQLFDTYSAGLGTDMVDEMGWAGSLIKVH